MRAILLALVLLAAPVFLNAQQGAVRYGKCGDTSRPPSEVREFYAPLFVSEDEQELRDYFGIRTVSPKAPMYSVTSERLCQQLMRPVREGFRRAFSDRSKPSDYLLSFLRIGDYYVVILGQEPGTLPPGLSIRGSLLIVDGTTMEYVGHVVN